MCSTVVDIGKSEWESNCFLWLGGDRIRNPRTYTKSKSTAAYPGLPNLFVFPLSLNSWDRCLFGLLKVCTRKRNTFRSVVNQIDVYQIIGRFKRKWNINSYFNKVGKKLNVLLSIPLKLFTWGCFWSYLLFAVEKAYLAYPEEPLLVQR